MPLAEDFARPEASTIVTMGIAILAVTVGIAIFWMTRRVSPVLSIRVGAVIVAAMAIQLQLAASGVLGRWGNTPPPFMLLVAASVLLVVFLAFSGLGTAMSRDLSFATLIGFLAFRFPLELVMHRAATEGVMPVQMSYSGFNFDILTGVSAILVAWMTSRNVAPRWLLWAWNLMGTILLFVIVTVAILSTPVFHAFGPDRLNTWVAFPPFVWLAGVLVPAALLGHLLLWRKLASR